jgi:hypothetical protein
MFIPQPNPRKLRTDRNVNSSKEKKLTIIEHKNKQQKQRIRRLFKSWKQAYVKPTIIEQVQQTCSRQVAEFKSKDEEEETELTIIEHKNKQKTAGPMTFEILETG